MILICEATLNVHMNTWSVCSYAYVYEVMINAIIINHDKSAPLWMK